MQPMPSSFNSQQFYSNPLSPAPIDASAVSNFANPFAGPWINIPNSMSMIPHPYQQNFLMNMMAWNPMWPFNPMSPRNSLYLMNLYNSMNPNQMYMNYPQLSNYNYPVPMHPQMRSGIFQALPANSEINVAPTLPEIPNQPTLI